MPIDRDIQADRSGANDSWARISADRSGLAADRSARALQAERRRFPSVKGSEIPPKLGQTLCSINRTQFWTKRGGLGRRKRFWHKKLKRTRRMRLSVHRSWRIREDHQIFRVFLHSLFIYIFFSFNSMFVMNSRIHYLLYIIMRG